MVRDEGLELFHATGQYNPAKAREYYLRTRELKGRQIGRAEPAPLVRQKLADTKTLTPREKKAPVSSRKSSVQKKEETKAKVARLEKKLDQLKDLLKRLVAEAKERSGVETKKETKTSSSSNSKTANSSTTDSKPTAAQKADKAKKAKAEYKKENPTSKKDEAGDLEKEIAAVREKIAKAKADIKEAIAKQRKSKTTQNRERSALQNGSRRL